VEVCPRRVWILVPVAMFQTRTSRSQPPLTSMSSHGTIAQTPITWPLSVFWWSPLVLKTCILALSMATTMYLSVRCRLVTTPCSGVICLIMLSPPFRQAASTIYFCLKCDRYDCVCGLLLIRGLLGPDSSDEVVKSGALVEGQDIIESSARFDEREANPYGPRAARGSERGSIVSESASEGRLYACLSQSSFQVKSSPNNSCHRLDTWEDLARVLGSSTKERT